LDAAGRRDWVLFNYITGQTVLNAPPGLVLGFLKIGRLLLMFSEGVETDMKEINA
jgi:hypothetical protein